jgi:hypothetical protein
LYYKRETKFLKFSLQLKIKFIIIQTMVQQFHFLTVCLVAALMANATMANDGPSASASASANANECMKDHQQGMQNIHLCVEFCCRHKYEVKLLGCPSALLTFLDGDVGREGGNCIWGLDFGMARRD